jgi:hypothetical protein
MSDSCVACPSQEWEEVYPTKEPPTCLQRLCIEWKSDQGLFHWYTFGWFPAIGGWWSIDGYFKIPCKGLKVGDHVEWRSVIQITLSAT